MSKLSSAAAFLVQSLSAHRRAATLSLIVMVWLAVPLTAQGPSAEPRVRQRASPISKFHLPSRGSSMPCERATKLCKSALSS
jgi:hypothetical protein